MQSIPHTGRHQALPRPRDPRRQPERDPLRLVEARRRLLPWPRPLGAGEAHERSGRRRQGLALRGVPAALLRSGGPRPLAGGDEEGGVRQRHQTHVLKPVGGVRGETINSFCPSR